jgi:acyl dehydratase
MTSYPIMSGPVAGEKLPELAIDLTRTFVISSALATRDFQPIHHDPAAAQRGGTDDIFLNALTTAGLIGRFVTDWAGLNCRMTSLKLRLGRPAVAGRTLRLSGEVSDVTSTDGTGWAATISVTGSTEDGVHVTAVASAELAGGAPVSASPSNDHADTVSEPHAGNERE